MWPGRPIRSDLTQIVGRGVGTVEAGRITDLARHWRSGVDCGMLAPDIFHLDELGMGMMTQRFGVALLAALTLLASTLALGGTAGIQAQGPGNPPPAA